jgi:hypothetical protein
MPIPTFTSNVPIGTQTLGQTVNAINNNFGNYNGLTAVNHGAPNSSNQGKHLFVEMPVQATPPTTLSGEGGLFTQTVGSPSASQLFYQKDGNATNFQMTGPMSAGSSGYTTLFGGLILQWATGTNGGGNTFPIAFPNNCFSVVTASQSSTVVGNANVSSVTKTGFIAAGQGASFYYMAIGN